MRNGNYTMASLHFFARTDNPKKYIKMKEQRIDDLLNKGISGSHNSVAKLLMEKYKYIYKCASIKHGTWYEFINHKWVKIDCAFTLRNAISDELVKEYRNLQDVLYEKIRLEEDQNQKELMYSKTVTIAKLIPKLENSNFKDGVVKECACLAYDPNFLKNIDENPYLLCFTNGVYDLKSQYFRDGCPDDYCTLCTGYEYIEYNPNDECVKQINEFMTAVIPNDKIRKYLFTLLSTTLSGCISEEGFYVFTGSGANGKSKLMELLKHALGDYFKPMDVRLLTEKRSSSSSASPEVADKKGIRACPFDEPSATDQINTGFMKIFTGGDLLPARALFSDPIYFKPQFKPFLLCNVLPSIKSDDEGTWRRLKVLQFLSKFMSPSDIKIYYEKQEKKGIKKSQIKLPKNHFPADNKLSEKLPDWKQSFMAILIKYYQDEYVKNGLMHPPQVTKYTAEYRKKCDVYQDFISDWLEPTDSDKDSISIVKLHEAMRTWYKSNYDGRPPATKDLREYIRRKLDTFNAGKDTLYNYRLKISDNEETIEELDNQ